MFLGLRWHHDDDDNDDDDYYYYPLISMQICIKFVMQRWMRVKLPLERDYETEILCINH